MKRNVHYTIAAVALLLAGCSQIEDDLSNCPDVVVSDSPYPASYISLRLTSAADNNNATRAQYDNPAGGEDGNGRLAAQTDYEYKVNEIVAFLYPATLNGSSVNLNCTDAVAATVPVTPVLFESGEIESQIKESGANGLDCICTTTQKSVNIESAKYNVLAVVNPSDALKTKLVYASGSSEDMREDLFLSDLRDYISTGSAWTESVSDNTKSYSNFLMSSEKEDANAVIDLGSSSGETTATIQVERVAARVDYKTNDSNSYGVTDSKYSGATVEILGAAMVNNLTSGSYLFKRVTKLSTYDSSSEPDISTDGVTYLGNETAIGGEYSLEGNGSVTGNYVIDPWTTEKKDGAFPTVSTIQLSYGTQYSGKASSGIISNGVSQEEPLYWDNLIEESTDEVTDDGTWYRVGYTLENTTFAPYTSKLYSTGVVFKALFTPSNITGTYTDGDTFFKYNNTLYATLEDIVDDVWDGTSYSVSDFSSSNISSTLSSETTWGDLSTYLESMPADPIGYKKYLLYLCDDNSAEGYISSYTNLSITHYMSTYLGYTNTSGVVVIGGDETPATSLANYDTSDSTTSFSSTYSALMHYSSEGVVTYKDAQCYYVWWIRHSNDDSNETNGVMEYSIVRNNIYKLDVTSVSTIGGAIPAEGLQIDININPWYVYECEELEVDETE